MDGYSIRYVYDGSSVIAEYDGNNNLLRKYIYGPGIDQPVSMIEVAQSNATYYYHFDALGSVVALSDAAGDTVQTYEYSVYGEVAVEDANHPNPYMFAGVRYDIEIGLYYNRARYYNPFTGRFLQTDPIGYGDGINWYTYCRNNPVGLTDPSGTHTYNFDWTELVGFMVTIYDDDGKKVDERFGMDPCDFYDFMAYKWGSEFGTEWKLQQDAGKLWANSTTIAGSFAKDPILFWEIQMLIHMDVFSKGEIRELGAAGVRIGKGERIWDEKNKEWVYNGHQNGQVVWTGMETNLGYGQNYDNAPALAGLAHELQHAYSWANKDGLGAEARDIAAVQRENSAREGYFKHFFSGTNVFPRMSYTGSKAGLGPTAKDAWAAYRPEDVVY